MKFKKAHNYTPAEIKKMESGRCVVKFCRAKRGRGHRCYKCEKRKFALEHPEKYCYDNLKGNARRREKYFDLTFDEFMIFLKKTDYMKYKGKGALCLSIDRKKNHLGYTLKNITAITLRANSLKRNYVDYPGKKMTHEEAKALAGTPF